MPSCRQILVIEDDELVRRGIVGQLEHFGYSTREAAGGVAGIGALRSERPDLVLCDLRMPDVDGLGVLEVATREFPRLPIIMITGAGVLGDAVGALKLGAWDYLLKPFESAGVLQHAIVRALERADLLQENDRYRGELERTNRELVATLRRLQEDEAAGRQIQFRLLPDNHQVFGEYEFSHDLETSAHLSGDFVDCFAIEDGHLGFYLADVAGHGVPSALVTVFLKSFMQQQIKRHMLAGDNTILSPARTVAILNDEMLREQLGKHLTMFYGVIDVAASQLTYVNAGQFPYPILVQDGQGHYIEDKGFPVGLFDFAQYGECSLSLPGQFTMALCSDGVLEVIEQETLPGRMAHLLSLVCERGASVQQLRDSLGIEGHRPLPDDVTLLMLRRVGHECHAGQGAVRQRW